MYLLKMNLKNYKHLIQVIVKGKIILKKMVPKSIHISANAQIFQED